jgi:hypothetical protein
MAAKISKADAGYGDGMPHCGVCAHYSEDEKTEQGACELVTGAIDEDAWCKLFKAKRKPTIAEAVK